MINQKEEPPAYIQHISAVGKKIYYMIKQNNMTKTDIRKRTSLPAKQVDDQLKRLAEYNLIKARKHSDKKNAKTWMLFNEKQQEEQQQVKAENQDLISLILKKDSTLQAVKKQAIKLAYSLQKFQEIVEMLKMKGAIFVLGDQIKIRSLKKINIPCITCQLKRLCSPGNTISPQTCPYLVNW